MRLVFFSDLHLMKDDHGGETYLLTFFDEVLTGADGVYVLGDLFEFCLGKTSHIYPWFKSIFDAFDTLINQGTQVFFLEGNHEFFMEELRKTRRIMFSQNLAERIEGIPVHLSHGHEFTSPVLNRLLRSTVISSLMIALGPDKTWKMAMIWRKLLSQREKGYNKAVRPVFRQYAEKKLAEGFDVVMFGHSHMADRYEYARGEKTALYLNTGDFRAHGTYVEYTSSSGFVLKRFHSTPSHKLRTINDL